VIPRSRRDLFKDQSFGESDNAGIKADMWHAGGVLHAKKGFRWGEGAHREWCSVGETRRRGTVVGVCLVPEGGVYKKLSRRSQVVLGLGEVIRSNL